MLAFLKPPVFQDETKTNQARLLNIILWALIAVPIPYVAYYVIAAPGRAGPALIQAGIGEAANIFLLILLKRGYVRAAALLQVIAFFLFFTMAAATGSSVRGPAYMLGYSLVIIIAGTLLGSRGAIIFTALVLISGGAMVYAEAQGLTRFAAPDISITYWVISIIIFPISALMQNLAAYSIQRALNRSRASEARYRLLFEESPDGIFIINSEGAITEINPAAQAILGYTPAEIIGRRPEDLVDPLQLVSNPFPVEQTLHGQTISREQVFVHKNGARIIVMGNIKKLPDGHFQYIFEDFTERKKAAENIAQREAILQAVAFAAERFFQTTEWSKEMDRVLEKLGSVLKASHAYLFQVYTGADGILRSSMRYEWCAPGYPSELNSPTFQDNPVIEPGYEKSYEVFNAGQLYIIGKPGDAQSPEEMKYLNDIGVKALIDIPITVNGMWWGTMGFDDCVNERTWSGAEIDALKVAGNVVSAAIERKLAEAALRASENRLRLAIESARIGIWDWDIPSNAVSWLEEVEAIFGMRPGTFDGKYETYLGLIHPDDLAPMQTAIGAALAGTLNPYYVEHRIVTPTGELRWLEAKGEVFRNEQGQPIRMIGTVMDITERKHTEQIQNITYRIAQAAFETKELGQLYRSIHAAINELMPARNFLIVLYDKANDLFNIAYLSDEYDNDTRPYRPGKGLCAYVMRTGEPILITPDSFAVLERAGVVEIILRRMVDWIGVPLKTQHGIIGVMAIQTYSLDVRLKEEHKDMLMFVSTQVATAIERQQSLEENHRLNAELEQRVQDRTARLEIANRELESFSYSVSHDLRAPLRAIRSYSQIIRADYSAALPPEAQNYLNNVIDGAHQMNDLIEALLSLARMSRSELNKTHLDLTAMAREVAHAYEQNESARPVAWVIAEGLSAYADEKLIHNVLQNLIGNAWKYTARAAAPRIEFGTLPHAPHQLPPNSVNLGGEKEGVTVFYVRDNGIGFDMKYKEKLFGAFQRLHSGDEYPGHGIGLATVQRIITRHGGRVWAEAAPDQGATFYFSLPAAEEA